jgi:hypothetical protein
MAGKPQIKTFEVRGVKYRTTLLPATQGRALYLKLMKAFGQGLNGLSAGLDNSATAGLGFVAGAIQGLDQSLLDELCEAFGQATFALRAGGEDHLKGDAFDDHFTGRYAQLTEWLVELVRINGMVDFLFEMLAGLGAKKVAEQPKP